MNDSIKNIISLFIIVAATIFGTYVLTTPILSNTLYGTKRTVFICMMFGYAALRLIRLYTTYKKMKNENKRFF
jgi:predicted membrane channel-forming protein YqfA (hemolysin III family)